MEFISYAHQDLSLKSIKKLAKQYDGVNVWDLMGIDEDEFPFLIWESEESYSVIYWTKHSGMMTSLDGCPVLNYAFALWLKGNAHPVFSNIEDAEKYAEEHNWPNS
ncbi:hypothetical protein HCH_01455 [Hahella chejuensis KCTC 2396]|uniref:Uncharacterized protein n=1 Tax=Hahella chejuensis (strain KCTC 2396) TaxID=349521 RepID=Q2SM09_HAHCH|nr:hypothetical protein [Hahella chejuensis]ABC28315.1 hypothetical protein HCH_01455 [Hahella chejuensis KCTC 2396]